MIALLLGRKDGMTFMRSNCMIACEVSRRVVILREEKKCWVRRTFAVFGLLCFAIFACVAMLPNGRQASDIHTVQASTLDLVGDTATGGYVLVGLVCFALGIAFALFCIWIKGRKK